jgi:glycosyltransferase involved in cell wall biosynthesis
MLRGGGNRRVVYVQYTNPAGYPPLEHSSEILAEAGWDVLFLGAEALGAASFRFPEHRGIQVRQLGSQSRGWRQKLHYLYFCCWCLWWILRHRASWVYASDLLSCPVASAAGILFRIPVIYHEHDSPPQNPAGTFARFTLWARSLCGRSSKICILPNKIRADWFKEQTHLANSPLVVWNCPRRREVAPPRIGESRRIAFLYHGSINANRLPLSIVDALAGLKGDVSLTVVGYETAGSLGYLKAFLDRGIELGIAERLNLIGPLKTRHELMEVCRKHDVGLAFMPLQSTDLNLRAMTGASNKPFDYLACGLALLVSSLQDWEDMFVRSGYGISCDPGSPESIAQALQWFCDHPEQMRAMGRQGREKILDSWNYEAQFKPVMSHLSAPFQRAHAPL